MRETGRETQGEPRGGRAAAAVLSWLLECGVDALTNDPPGSWFEAGQRGISRGRANPGIPAAHHPSRRGAAPASAAPSAAPRAAPAPVLLSRGALAGADGAPTEADAAREPGHAIAAACRTLGELEAALEGFDGCSLRTGSSCTVFADGDPASGVMLIGEAPGAEEERQGKPFVGPAGRLLDRMLAAIGRDRRSIYISNVVYWRPPANRTPSDGDITACMPFVRRQIELVRPRAILAVGSTAAKALLATTDGINRLRGRWHSYEGAGTAIPLRPVFHPAYLLRQPAHKALAWADLLAFRQRIDGDA